MSAWNPETLDWLAAERRGDDAAAEGALRSLFAALPLEAPSAGFSQRVLARTRRAATREPEVIGHWLPTPASRWGALTLAFASFMTLVLARVLSGWLPEGPPGAMTRGAADLLTWLWDGLTVVALVWQRLVEWAAWLGRLVQIPAVGWTLLAAVLLSAGAFLLLQYLLVSQRNWTYAQTPR